MAKNSNVSIQAKAETLENEKTKKQKKEASSIEQQMKDAEKKAKQARKEAEEEKKRLEEEERKRREEEEKRLEEEAKQKELEEQQAAEAKAQLLAAGAGLAASALTSKKGIGSFLKGLLVGLIIGALGVFFLMRRPVQVPESPDINPVIEEHDIAIEDNGILGFTAADLQDAILGEASEHQELIVMEQPLSIQTSITQAGLGNLAIFSKVKNITYYGTGVYTVDLSHIDAEHIAVDEDAKTVTVRIPHAVLQYINPDLDKTEFEDTEKGLLAFSDIKLTTEDQNALQIAIRDAMKERLEKNDLFEQADRLAELKTWQIFQPLITAVSAEYTVSVQVQED
ncbi:MAG: DUF4230 domain-containing protein [Solobacterium sp.]|nr:DUF4230 domain-containing protein [Solobacterium sp.]